MAGIFLFCFCLVFGFLVFLRGEGLLVCFSLLLGNSFQIYLHLPFLVSNFWIFLLFLLKLSASLLLFVSFFCLIFQGSVSFLSDGNQINEHKHNPGCSGMVFPLKIDFKNLFSNLFSPIIIPIHLKYGNQLPKNSIRRIYSKSIPHKIQKQMQSAIFSILKRKVKDTP